jgi:hypothetical protein
LGESGYAVGAPEALPCVLGCKFGTSLGEPLVARRDRFPNADEQRCDLGLKVARQFGARRLPTQSHEPRFELCDLLVSGIALLESKADFRDQFGRSSHQVPQFL